MKKKAMFALILAFALFTCAVAFAHPPKAVSASWNASNNKLTVTAEHSVNDASKHYVLNLTIFDGNKQLLQKQYSSQASVDGFNDSFILEGLPSGKTIRIQLVCNIMGATETEFTIS